MLSSLLPGVRFPSLINEGLDVRETDLNNNANLLRKNPAGINRNARAPRAECGCGHFAVGAALLFGTLAY